MIAALKSGDANRRSLLGMVMASIKNKELEKRGRLIKTITDPVQLEGRVSYPNRKLLMSWLRK